MVVEKNVRITERFFDNRYKTKSSVEETGRYREKAAMRWKIGCRLLSKDANSDQKAHKSIRNFIPYLFTEGSMYLIQA